MENLQDKPPSIGRIVHVVVKDGNGNLKVRPGIVVETFPGNAMNGTCNINVHQDGTNDGGDPLSPVRWMSSVRHVEPESGQALIGEENTWHWPPRE